MLPSSVENEKQSGNNTLLSPVVLAKAVTQQHVIVTIGKRKTKHATTRCFHWRYTQNSHTTTRCLHRGHTQKTATQQHATHKTVTQQHVSFTSGTRKNSHATIRCLPSPVEYANNYPMIRRKNSMLSSPVVFAKTAPKQQVAFTSGIQ